MANEVLIAMRPAETETLRRCLQAAGFAVESVSTIPDEQFNPDILTQALAGDFALLILDAAPLTPRSVGGMEHLRRLRQRSLLPVLMISEALNDAERILALELGADDYLHKPYLPQELLARIRAILRRTHAGVSAFRHLLKAGNLELDKLKRTVKQNGRELVLTAVEFDLLELLMRRVGQVVSREEIAHTILGRALNHNDRSIDMHVSNLRRKLSGASHYGARIKAIRGVGYSFTVSSL
ncbi:MAG: response regulator transcription factor [Acidobacteria bacterium]|nr:response regulator transcription factor [Acidobacteriota bacterium]